MRDRHAGKYLGSILIESISIMRLMKTFALSKPEKINPALLITFRTTSESIEYNHLDDIETRK